MSTAWLWVLALGVAIGVELVQPTQGAVWAMFPVLSWMMAAVSGEKDPVMIIAGVGVSTVLLGWFSATPWVLVAFPLVWLACALVLYRFFVAHRSLLAALVVLMVARALWGGLWWVVGWQETQDVVTWMRWMIRVFAWDVVLLTVWMTVSQRARRWLGRTRASLSSYERY
ncbi:hypothetical protein KBD13_02715 [Patescibacteria group bacterium]|nr:hypothetical protein [Patescibacteria group bacterium]